MLRKFAVILVGGLIMASAAIAQQATFIDADAVKARMHGKHPAVLIDARMPDEYQAGHIPGAINIPAEKMKAEAARLPKDKSAPIIFYCRGMS
jgi:rhodanese-related sulfurtransferase